MERNPIQPQTVSTPASNYSQALVVECGRVLFVSGQVPVDGEGNLVGAGDFPAQASQVFENIKAIVEEAGGSMANVIKITVFLTDIATYKDFAQVRSQYVQEPYPAATLVAVQSLVDPQWMIEVEAIAAL